MESTSEAASYDRQGRYTVEDYYALDDDIRRELIDGVFYDMAAPSAIHQELIGKLYISLSEYVEKKNGKCKVFLSPFDVQLDRDQWTMVQPDLVVICKRNKITRKNCFGAPEMVIEVVSPSSARKDCIIKREKYRRAGVHEYWIVDPDHKIIMVYSDLTSEKTPELYDFSDRIPVAIWNGEYEVDFADIYSKIRYLYDPEL